MKRAVFVTAGTVAGLVASFSYTPGLLPSLLADDHDGKPVNASTKEAKGTKSEPSPSKTTGKEDGARHKGTKNDTHQGGQAKNSGQGGGTSQSGGGSDGSGGSGAGSVSSGSGGSGGSGSVSGSTSGGSSGSQPKPKPTKSDKPKPTPKPTQPAQPKTFAGNVASTPYGPVQVSITVLSGRITDVSALQMPSADPKSVQIANRALPRLRSETLAAQSASIAVVSGATYTSKGWISSLQSALSKAGL